MQDNSRTMTERIGIHYLFEEIDITGVRHLKARNLSARSTWSGILVLFTALTLYQIYEQIDEFLGFPTVTNIEAEYPSEILFPAIAVCPNNQYRISYLASKEVLKRVPPDNRTIGANWAFFIKTINRMWDVPAEEFLRSAVPELNTTIISCTLPDGTACDMSQWKQIWTINGLCWAFNYDKGWPIVIDEAGPSHSLRLILNAETYERPTICGATVSTPPENGFKILIYDQDEQPISTATGASVVPGFSTNLPFRIKLRRKMPDAGCLEETDVTAAEAEDFFDERNIHTCAGRLYHHLFENQCNCSVRSLYTGCDGTSFTSSDAVQHAPISRAVTSRCTLAAFSTSNKGNPGRDLSELPKSILPSRGDYMLGLPKAEASEKRFVGFGPDGSRVFEEKAVNFQAGIP
ncbi:unnamed protein product, partial [Mesorhabditis spiculigera]